ncbi:phytanoyl-CoA dioxygenase family protein [Nonomuraea purpurea]|uniref:Phytanoyl-CoA dioxygenase family protein n=1 Tax=Nonomuraea purpurea TaxID=1849276 RepID=A0ABV8GSB2_9ACTN
MPEVLPCPTADPSQAARNLDRHGFCVLTDALPSGIRAEMRARITEQAIGERKLDAGTDDGAVYLGGAGRAERANRRVWALMNKGEIFQQPLMQADVLQLVSQVLGPDFLLSAIQANFVSPHDDPLPFHSDQGYVTRPWPPYSLTASVIWMLDDFTEKNGATTVVPGTHLPQEDDDPNAMMVRARLIRKGGIPICGPAGSALIFDGRIMHGTGINTTDATRLAVLTYFCRPFLRQQENFALSVAPHVLDTLPDSIKALLGFQVWKTLGSVEGVCAEGAIVERPQAPTGAVNTTGEPLYVGAT